MRATNASSVAVVILNYNGGQYTPKCIDSVLKSSYRAFRVILVDNGSTDGSLEAVEEQFGANITVIKNPKNYGYGRANNTGAQLAETNYIAFLHNDTVVDRNWLNEAINVMDADPTIGAAQSLVKPMIASSPPLIGGLISHYTILENPPLVLGSSHTIPCRIAFSVGVASIIRRNLLEEVGLFDPDYFLSNEDLDLGWRIGLSGHKIVGIPKSMVYHQGGVGGNQLGALVGLLHFRNTLVTMVKNLTLRNVFLIVPISVILYVIYGMGHLIIYRKRKVFLSKILPLKEIFWIILNLRSIWRKREFVQKKVRRVRNDDLLVHVAESNHLPSALVTRPLPHWTIRRLNRPL